MLEVIGFSLLGWLMEILGRQPVQLPELQLLSWQEAEIFNLPTESDPLVEEIIEQYLNDLSAQGFVREHQRVWIQSDWIELANYQGRVPASAASFTKIATTLSVLEKWGTDYQFKTSIYATGEINQGVLNGDLIISGSGDPLFVWEEAIALGNALNQLGIRQVTGNLVITGQFYFNYKSNSLLAGKLLKQGLNSRLWSSVILKQYQTLPENTPRPQIAIAGNVLVQDSLPDSAKLLLHHNSMSLVDILKEMNIYSNNVIAEMLAQSVGGAQAIAQKVAQIANFPLSEIQLINGSGLGIENRISPRAACAMLIAIERKLQPQSLSLTDLFPVAGRDQQGTMLNRNIPPGVTVKTGTLRQVSALSGVISTEERGLIWFAIINHGNNIEKLRRQQDQVLQKLSQHWQLTTFANSKISSNSDYLGNPTRNFQAN